MANEAFDPKAANQEFRVIRKRTRELERGMALHLSRPTARRGYGLVRCARCGDYARRDPRIP